MPHTFKSSLLLDGRSSWRQGVYDYESGNGWNRYEAGDRLRELPPGARDFVVPTLPVEFHCHGTHGIDFSDFETLDLFALDAAMRKEGVFCVPTLYVPKPRWEDFLVFVKNFGTEWRAGRFTNLLGLAIEGPLFSSFGGTPKTGVWPPTKREWADLAQCSNDGFQYVVLSPDAMLPGSGLAGSLTSSHPSLAWIVELLLEHGVRPALGHFLKSDPEASALCVREVFDVAERVGVVPYGGQIVTDHLFNDMPCNIRYAWRTPEQRASRQADLERAALHTWTADNLEEKIGSVPATIVQGAMRGILTMCINFDGEHVDLEVSKRIVEIAGAHTIIAMTDRCDSGFLGGQRLSSRQGTTLLYQQEGIVAAGSQTIDRVLANMRSAGISEKEAWEMAAFTPLRVLGRTIRSMLAPSMFSYVRLGFARFSACGVRRIYGGVESTS